MKRIGYRLSAFEAGLAGLALLICPSPASAHLVTTGMGPIYDGIGHLLLTPEDLVPVLALALFAGRQGVQAGIRTMFLLPLTWFLGGAAGLLAGPVPAFPAAAVSFLVVGALVAADQRMPANAVSFLACVVGLAHGFFNGAALKDGAGLLGMLGIAAILFVLVAIASAFAVSLKKDGARIAVRVAGSWVCASGLLMVGWLIRGTR